MLLLTLTGCSKDITGTAEQMCQSWQTIRPSRKDVLTQGTKEQIAGNNAANEAWCQGSTPQKVAGL